MLIVVIYRGHSIQVTTQHRWALQVAHDYVQQVNQARSLFKSAVQYRKFLVLQSKKFTGLSIKKKYSSQHAEM